MAYKDIERRREAIREHYYKNKEKYIEKNRLRRIAARKRIHSLKESTPCADCKKMYPYYVMDFDHLENKQGLISKLVNANNINLLNKELEKCEVVCANCHRLRTFKRLQAAKSVI